MLFKFRPCHGLCAAPFLSPLRYLSTSPLPHPKLSVKQVAPKTFKCSKENLNVVFAPGTYGGQLMSQALSSVIASTPSIFNPSNLSCYFLGPTLVNEDVYFTVDKDISVLPSKPVTFELTASFYRTPSTPDDGSALSFSLSSPPLTVSDFESSLSLSTVSPMIKSGALPRSNLYKKALSLTSKCTSEMLIKIRLPSTPSHTSIGLTSYFVGVPNSMGLHSKVILPYISDCMTQVLSACDTLDAVWDGWPSKLTVWSYSMNLQCNGGGSEGKPFVDDEGTRWYVIDYRWSGVVNGIGNGTNTIHLLNGGLLSTSSYQVLAAPPKGKAFAGKGRE